MQQISQKSRLRGKNCIMAVQKVALTDEQYKLKRISELGDPLVKLNNCIHWNIFCRILNNALKKEAKGPGGRPAYDYVMMFKILILQEYFGLSDHQAEFQITDRLSFMRFLGLGLLDKVPDQNTIWTFREQLKKKDVVKKLFDRFVKELRKGNFIVNKGRIIDASIIEVPIQRNTLEENEGIKEGKVPKKWRKKKRSH